MLSATVDKYNADYLIVDMSPSLGPVNQNLLMTSDHFVVPLHPDYFSQMALSSLTRVLPVLGDQAAGQAAGQVLSCEPEGGAAAGPAGVPRLASAAGQDRAACRSGRSGGLCDFGPRHGLAAETTAFNGGPRRSRDGGDSYSCGKIGLGSHVLTLPADLQ
jgi:hypothetical protein